MFTDGASSVNDGRHRGEGPGRAHQGPVCAQLSRDRGGDQGVGAVNQEAWNIAKSYLIIGTKNLKQCNLINEENRCKLTCDH